MFSSFVSISFNCICDAYVLLTKSKCTLQAQWKLLTAAFNFPVEEPFRGKCHWDYVLEEAAWLAHDFMQASSCFNTHAMHVHWRWSHAAGLHVFVVLIHPMTTLSHHTLWSSADC